MKNRFLFLLLTLGLLVAASKPASRPTLYLIGDSTVRNGSGKGADRMWGWGSFLAEHFDTTRIAVRNHAIGGRSSRTFLTEGRWDKILSQLKPGDFVMMQFGHNDNGPLADTARARGTLKGIGEESEEIYNPITKKQEVVHTYGWYMRKYVKEAKAKGATPIVLSLVPRNQWQNGKIIRGTGSYGTWAADVAKAENAYFIDLNEIVAKKYDALGDETKLKATYFVEDHTHTNEAGAKLNAESVIEGLRGLKKCPLNKYVKK
ncbi:rhamnogalacturonan acetylesterase [Hymenobacter sp. BT491]|uniref:rhamnogalacturonan acetylesterase n=1 Tax=Hymenobacter sp. BT491 TaxID=2766779 RepID=UPI001653C7FC|nr:rhamnogalacturonan acetylesterase [Hymenobacter sp. BT491]MBC6988204.1 rhamnogalacturonan acetylesterase [Hymenobacter sp. BT491]